ncbi:MAG: isocitrate lyase/phosphoenolpyruvate mutase family protein [Methylobacterium mesophilicum]|nr:isocitrate lyase/phosphoenolpyruvate mutase family protein [Methylobacterium mesophilicum]
MASEELKVKSARFRALHDGRQPFIMPNPFDIGTAKLLVSLGYEALATTSAGFAFTRGLPDGGVPFDQRIAHAKEMAASVEVPVSADLEKGKGDSAESAGETVFAAEAAGLAGCSVEDHTGEPAAPIYEFTHAIERVQAAVEAARAFSHDFILTARAENMLWGGTLDDTIRRLVAFEQAGADVLFAPGLDMDGIRAVMDAVTKPINVLAGPGMRMDELAALGVRRISVGSKLSTTAFGAVRRAAREMRDAGTFTFAEDVMGFGELQDLFAPDPLTRA